jgi:hypothetical protein
VDIRMRFDGPLLAVPRETRELAFQAINFQWEERGDNDEVLATG